MQKKLPLVYLTILCLALVGVLLLTFQNLTQVQVSFLFFRSSPYLGFSLLLVFLAGLFTGIIFQLYLKSKDDALLRDSFGEEYKDEEQS